MIGPPVAGIAACRTARRFAGAGVSREAFEAWQGARVARWLARDVPRVARYGGREWTGLADLPIVDKAEVMAAFQDFNRGGITADDGWAAVRDNRRIGGVSLGLSTGTSGNRSLYAVTNVERARWFGAILAKALPDLRFGRDRVAVLLPQASALYETARRSRLLGLQFFNLRDGIERFGPALETFTPTVIVAPPRVLRESVERGLRLTPRRVFSGAETLDPVDRPVIEAGLGCALGQIYMASEGLFGVSCGCGRLHLAEESTCFEFEEAGDGLVAPLVSTFARSFQIMARYRMNDLLRLSPEPCPCGSPLRAVEDVVGRMDDVFRFGGGVFVTPDVLRNAVLDADRTISDFRIRQIGAEQVELVLPEGTPAERLDAARRALDALLVSRRRGIALAARTARLEPERDRKLRRVEVVPWEGQ